MNGIIIFLGLVVCGIAIWAGVTWMRARRRASARPRPRVIAPSPVDPYGAARMRKGELDSPSPDRHDRI